MSNIKDKDLENVSGGMDPVDIQQDQPTDLGSKDSPPPPTSGGSSGGPGAPGINDLQQNNDGPASGA